MAINTLITIRDAIQAFVDGHGQLQAVGFGADDKRAPYLTEQDLFPVLYVAPVDVEVGRAHNTHRLRVYVYERLNDGDQDEWENANDTSLILRDIRVWWNDYGVDDILIETDPTGTFKTDSELDNLVGYYAEILFQIPSHGRCDVPVYIEPVPPAPTCEDATVQLKDSAGNNIGIPDSYASGSVNNKTAPDGTVTVNRDGVFFDTQVVRSNGSETINVPSDCPPQTIQGALPIKTFQTTSQGTGSDGDTQMGRGATHTTLPYNNLHGNTTRFLDLAGGTSFSDFVMVDWLSWDGRVGTVMLVYFDSDVIGVNRNYNAGRDYVNGLTVAGFSDWAMINEKQLQFLMNQDVSFGNLNFAPLNIGSVNIGTSTAYATHRVYRTTNGGVSIIAKTTGIRTLAVRIATVTLVGSTVVFT